MPEHEDMVTLLELKQMAIEKFRTEEISIPMLLCAWAEKEPENIKRLLSGTGISFERFCEKMQALTSLPRTRDQNIILECILHFKGKTVLAIDFLEYLCKNGLHQVIRNLVTLGLDLQKLQANIEANKPPKPDLLARLGAGLDLDADALLKYGRDLTQLARKGLFDDLADRPKELDLLIKILLRKEKKNCVITGPAGVGKSALVELFARKLAKQELGNCFAENTRIFEISMGRLVAGTKYRGDFEQRFHEVIDAVLQNMPAMLFIDEMHLIWGAGRAEGVITDAANLLKPFLARGELQLIGATTTAEYRRYIAKDKALARRFQELKLKEPDISTIKTIVQKKALALSKHHGLVIPLSLISKAIDLPNTNMPYRHQPDKTIELLDTACVMAKQKGEDKLTQEHILRTLSELTQKPVSLLKGNQYACLRSLKQKLSASIIGQEEAIDKIVSTLSYRLQGLGPEQRNLGTFMFVGDTGVGKSETARVLTKALFGSLDYLLYLDLAEYNQPSAVHKLIGAPPGFTGSEEEGVLVSWLSQKASGVLLLDEIEKAHLEVQQLFLGMLDNGRIRSAQGEEFSTTQCIVILTTNAITAKDLDRGAVGFSPTQEMPDPTSLLSDHFPREFLSRFDEILLFNTLGARELKAILKLRLEEAIARLERNDICIRFDRAKLLDYLETELEKNQTGARGIQRILETKLLQPISLAIVESGKEPPVVVCVKDEFFVNGNLEVIQKESS